MTLKELSGSDIVKIINAGSKANMHKIIIGDLLLFFSEPLPEPIQLPLFEGGEVEESSPLSEDEQAEFEMAQLAINDPVLWEERQLNPEKFES